MLNQSVVDDKPFTLFVDEYKMIKDSWFADLECLLKNNISSLITRKSDILGTMARAFVDYAEEKHELISRTLGDESKRDNRFLNLNLEDLQMQKDIFYKDNYKMFE